jgi:hypothetical protein
MLDFLGIMVAGFAVGFFTGMGVGGFVAERHWRRAYRQIADDYKRTYDATIQQQMRKYRMTP